MKSKIDSLKIKGYDFTGYILVENMEYRVDGQFSVRFNGQYPKVEVIDIGFSDVFEDSDLSNIVDLVDLEDRILDTDDGSWYDDYLDYRAEQQWERMEDR